MNKLLLFLLIFNSSITFSQTEDAWLFLKDKPNEATFLANPLTMLSQRALDRRNNQNIVLDSKDVPVDENYYNQLKNEGTITVLAKSKWLNAVHVQGEVNDINDLLVAYTFIGHIEFANKSLNSGTRKRTSKTQLNHQNKFNKIATTFDYGEADNQIKMLKGDYLHEQGLTGENQIIAIIDAGFPNVNTLSAFQRVRDNNQILGGYNFADRNTDFYTRSSHGTHVLSTIAGYVEDEFVGTAPDAKFYLFISEITETETVLEESLWVEAAERADSLGVNVINTSLGYTTYDNPNHSHSYADMDGKTTFITRGAEIGASRGILLVNSVGNSGNDSWKYMGAPADSPSVISVGAVNASRNIASFSSFGPTVDNRIKPEILAQGDNSAIINHINGAIVTADGTSFSSPIMAGLIACLNGNTGFVLKTSANFKSKNSQNLNRYLKDAIYQSSDKFNNPSNQYGYGIPDFEEALNLYIVSTGSINENILSELMIYPNPVDDFFGFSSDIGISNDFKFQVHTILGKKVLEFSKVISNKIDISNLDKGIYMLKIQNGNQQKIIKLIKQ